MLCVVPAFPPVNAADGHRVRMMLPYLAKSGWGATVLTVRPEDVAGVKDPELEATVPAGTEIRRVWALPLGLTRRLGFGSLGFRAGFFLKREGDRLLRQGGYDAVYFSSTVFSTFPLGPKWEQRHGVPFFLDYQDPWWSSYHGAGRGQRPPGGWLKYGLGQMISKRQEGRVLPKSAGVTCVSPRYVEMLRKRYPQMGREKFLELPFGAPEQDAELVGLGIEDRGVRNGERDELWRYIGRGGPDMAAALRIYGEVLTNLKEKRSFRLELAGTSYATGSSAERTMAPVLGEFLPPGAVTESPDRIGYLETLRRLKGADRLVLFGSDDPAYTASKLYNYVLSRRPLLVICREESTVGKIVRETKAGEVITFGEDEVRLGGRIKIRQEWKQAMERWLAMDPAKEPGTDWQAFREYTAEGMTKKLCRFFDQRLDG